MFPTLNKPILDNLADEIWKSAERLCGKFKAYEYQSVILPIIVIRRLECVLTRLHEDKAAIDRQVGTLLAYRKSLIHECVTGQWRISQEDMRRATRALPAERTSQ